jgi:ribosomal protein S18 acetylase RimI-like enzyme
MEQAPRRLTLEEVPEASAMMARAFRDDPFVRLLAPDEAALRRMGSRFVGVVVAYCARYGEVWTVRDLAGAACWLPPGATSPTPWRMLRTGMLTMPFSLGITGFQRFNAVVSYAEKLHKASVAGPHWYLWGLGVEPSRQGQGIGGALLRPVLERAAGQPCYLETQNAANLPFYERLGFRVAEAGEAPGTGLTVWAMVRD